MCDGSPRNTAQRREREGRALRWAPTIFVAFTNKINNERPTAEELDVICDLLFEAIIGCFAKLTPA